MTRRPNGSNDADSGYVHDDPVVDAALDWFWRLRDSQPDDGTLSNLTNWLDQDPRRKAEFQTLEAIWGASTFAAAVRQLPANQTHTAPARARWRQSVAATLTLAILALGLWQYPRMALAWRADYLTDIGLQSTVTLPDGSTMMLNADSAVGVDFTQGRRDITLLRGEAWFDVRHDPAHPFRVSGGFGRTEVKGTSFSVQRQKDQDQVVLERGRVQITCLCPDQATQTLNPGETARVTASGPQPATHVDPQQALIWREGRIAFDDLPLDQIAQQIERYHNGRIVIANQRIGQIRLSGNYRLDDIQAAIRTLADAAGARMTRLPGGIIVLR